jgi:RNA polymerase sigma-70 factor (ECF subfamily)
MPYPGPPAAASDIDLITRIRAGDQRAFERMFRTHYDALCRWIATYVGERDAAEDIVQGVFARIWERHAHFHPDGALGAYLYAAVRRSAVSRGRHEAVQRRAAPFLVRDAADDGGTADAEFAADELARRFERALAMLPPRTREAFELSRGEGLSYNQIALRMGISVKTVGVHVGKSLTLLRKSVMVLIAAAIAGIHVAS